MNTNWLLVCVLGLFMGPVALLSRSEDTPEAGKDDERDTYTVEQLTVIHERGVKLLQKTAHGRFVLAGEVVDQEGKPLPDVSLKVGMSQMKGWGWNPAKDFDDKVRNSVLKDGSFRIDVSPYYDVSLHFEKEGYYPEELYYRFDYEPEDEAEQEERAIASERIMRGEEAKVKEGVVRDENIRVVMEKKGVLARLTRYKGLLEYVSGYGGKTVEVAVIDFQSPPVPDYKIMRIPASTAHLLPSSCMYMLCDEDEDGRIATEERLAGEYGQHKYVLPKRLRIVMSDPGGGFIEYVPDDGKVAWWQMKLAPESGYARELVVDVEKIMNRIVNVDGTYSGIYFYFKTGGRYGKGVVKSTEVDDLTRMSPGGKFELQTDGSRNVDTGRNR